MTLSALADGRWRPGIGDPTVYGWLTVAAYALVAMACFRAQRPGQRRAGRVFWLAMAVCFAFLAVNKQLDLQSLLTQVGRELAIEWNWYEQHRRLQRWFIAAVGGTALVAAAWMWLLVRGGAWTCRLAFGGLVLTIGFVLIRAASFHHVDHLLGRRFAALPMNFVLELGGITMAGLGAFLHLRRNRGEVETN